MSDDLESLLNTEFLEPPEDFTARVMARIDQLPPPEAAPQPSPTRERIQWIAFIGAGLVAAAQLAAFMFGIWTAAAAS